MWHMGVDTTTNPASHTQAQSIIKAQKDGGSPRFFQPGRKKGTAAGGAELVTLRICCPIVIIAMIFINS